MRLTSGQYLGVPRRELVAEGVKVYLTCYEPLARQPWHTHSNTTFFLLLRGQHRDENRHFGAYQKALSINYHPTFSQHRSDVGPEGMWGINIELTSDWLDSQGLTEACLGQTRILDESEHQFLSAKFVSHCFASPLPPQELSLVVLELVEAFAPDLPANVASPEWLSKACERIEEGFSEKLTIDALADWAGVHPIYFIRAFKRYYGTTVHKYITERRVAKASRLILQGMPVGEAAAEAGFADQAHFTRTCKALLGVQPSALKALCA